MASCDAEGVEDRPRTLLRSGENGGWWPFSLGSSCLSSRVGGHGLRYEEGLGSEDGREGLPDGRHSGAWRVMNSF